MEAHQIVKDFTVLNFYNQDSCKVSRSRAPKWLLPYIFDMKGINPLLLSTFPTNDDIQEAARQARAMEECESLLVLLGVDPTLLPAQQESLQLPAITYIAVFRPISSPE